MIDDLIFFDENEKPSCDLIHQDQIAWRRLLAEAEVVREEVEEAYRLIDEILTNFKAIENGHQQH